MYDLLRTVAAALGGGLANAFRRKAHKHHTVNGEIRIVVFFQCPDCGHREWRSLKQDGTPLIEVHPKAPPLAKEEKARETPS